MKAQSLDARVAALEKFVFFQHVITVTKKELEEQLLSEQTAGSGHELRVLEIRLLLLAALKHRGLKDLVNVNTRDLVLLLVNDLELRGECEGQKCEEAQLKNQ